jgi:hypothetical protein
MKAGKNPTREQRKLMVNWKLDPTMWLVSKDTTTEMTLVHRYFDKVTKIIPKGGSRDG